MKSCLLCGVGGQGTVLASRIIAASAMKDGLFARTAETIGMAQRGGCVVSHVRVGESVPSPMITDGTADVILGFEPGEAVRNLHYLKENGTVIVCDRAVQAVTASLSGSNYEADTMINYIKSKVKKVYVINTEKVFAECGSEKVINMALVGALAECGDMGLTKESINAAIAEKVKPQFIEMNEKALKIGAGFVKE